MKIGRGETNHLFVDVDGTLLSWPPPGRPGGPTEEQRKNARAYLRSEAFEAAWLPKVDTVLVENVRQWHKASGGTLVIWSMGGAEHAAMARDFCGLPLLRVVCIGKPDLAVDDNPLVWSKHRLDVVGPGEFRVP